MKSQIQTVLALCLLTQSVYCSSEKEMLQLVQKISSYVGLAILAMVVIYICGCITVVLYCAWRGMCRDVTDELSEVESVRDVRPPSYHDIFKGRRSKNPKDSSEPPSYDSTIVGDFPFPVNTRLSRRSSRISIASNHRRNSIITI